MQHVFLQLAQLTGSAVQILRMKREPEYVSKLWRLRRRAERARLMVNDSSAFHQVKWHGEKSR